MELKTIQTCIYEVRGQKVMLDFDLAALYGVETKNLNLAVKRNRSRFPNDFMFKLRPNEWKSLRLQIATSNTRGGTRYLPNAFTEQGVSMLSSVLRSSKAIKVNIAIMRAFVFMRKYALSHQELSQKLIEMEAKYNRKFRDLWDAIQFLMRKDQLKRLEPARKPIGFKR